MSRILRAFFRRALIAFAFVATFMIDVRVKAEPAQLPEAKTLEQEPADCWKSTGPCAVRTGFGERALLKWGDHQLAVGESTLFVRVSDSSLRVLDGVVWIKAKSPVTIESEFGKILSEAGEFWVTRTADRMTASAVSEPLWLAARGSIEKLEVAPGLENWLGRVQPKIGRAQTGVPIAIDLKSHLARWSKLYAGKRADFEREAEDFYGRWSEAAQTAAEIHKALFDRKLASIDKDEAKRAEERRRVQARTDELVRMFKSRVLDP